jgi:hypothetical protein
VQLAVSLVKDKLANLHRFVDGNLGHGIDHVVVVLDGPHDAETYAFLDAHPQASWILADAAWWGEDFIDALSARQRRAANLVNTAAVELGFVDWLFFLDGDEVAQLDRNVLAAVPAGERMVRLSPLESVASEGSPDADRLFKRLLSDTELEALARAGLVRKASNRSYFHGHVAGKVGIRPATDLKFRLHAADDAQGNKLVGYQHPRLRHLHFESPTFDEFVRKWTSMASAGPMPAVRHRRSAILAGFQALRGDADPTSRQRELYEEYVVEDAEGLRRHGVLESIDVWTPSSHTSPLNRDQVEALESELRRLSALPKRLFGSYA